MQKFEENNMTITTERSDRHGSYLVEYTDVDTFSNLDLALFKQSYGICFVDGKLLIRSGDYGGTEKQWGYIGGRKEPGETPEQTLHREVQEESNMEIISFLPIGVQKVTRQNDGRVWYELRYVCKVRPMGAFVKDGAGGGSTEIKLIDPGDYKKYVDWGEIGDRLIIRALELLPKL